MSAFPTPTDAPLVSTRRPLSNANTIRLVVLGVLFVVGASVILLTPLWAEQASIVRLDVGDVAAEDILAPVSLTYESALLTADARVAAEESVEDIFKPPDPQIVRQQVIRARNVNTFITTVRADSFASEAQKLADLRALVDVSLSEDTARALLNLSDERWGAIQSEVTRVIEAVMSATVTERRLADVRAQVPRLVSVNLSVSEAELVAALARPLVVPNSLFDEDATNNARLAAREAVTPVPVTYVQGQTVVERGRIISPLDYEALNNLGLLEPPPENRWQDPLGRVLAVVLVFVLLVGYLLRVEPQRLHQVRDLSLTVLLMFLTLGLAAWLTPNFVVLRYLTPASAVAIIATVLLGPQLALLLALSFGLLVGSLANGQIDLTLYMALGAMMAVITLGKAERVTSFFWAGVAAAAINGLVVLAFRLGDADFDAIGLATLMLAGGANGLLSASVALVGLFLLSPIFDITTSLRLVELMRPDHPLLQDLLRKAPGTYQHSLQIANLTEQAAEAIHANAMLCRVGALYHDIGKMHHPQYFVENLAGQENPHERLDPHTSAEIIIGHVLDGLEMAKHAGLPRSIVAAIAEHHGTGVTMYQYTQALRAADGDESKVDKTRFMYPGPKPQSRETALIMLADGCEAKSRADLPKDETEIRAIVDSIFDGRLREGQLDQSGLTLGELEAVRESFVGTLKGIYHSRIKYPAPAGAAPPAAPSIEGPAHESGERGMPNDFR